MLYFLAGYWDFYNAVKESGKFYYLTVNNHTETIQPTLPADDELHFWLRAGLFLCVIVLALFSLAGMAIVVSYRICNGGWASSKVIVFFPFLYYILVISLHNGSKSKMFFVFRRMTTRACCRSKSNSSLSNLTCRLALAL